jgi:exopolysaccharide production protein ExoZ
MKLDTIQALRGLAALAVALYHLPLAEAAAIGLAGSNEAASLAWLSRNGFAGVDVFFVISGFIMVYVTANRDRGARSAGDFLLARIIRVYPLWWLFAAAAVVISLAATGAPVHPDFGVPGDALAGYLVKSFALIPQDYAPVLNVGWTLIHEMYFYLVFAIILLFPARILPWALAAWSAGVALVALAFSGPVSGFAITELIFHPLTLEFSAGAAAGLLITKGVTRFARVLAGLGGLGLLVAMGVADGLGHDGWGRVIVFGLPAALLVYGLAAMDLRQPIRLPRALVFLGDASYALYLAHTLVYLIARRVQITGAELLDRIGAPDSVVAALQLGNAGPLDNLIFWTLGLGGSLLAAALVHRVVERPALNGLTAIRKRVV